MKKKGKLVVLSGPSGVGKDTVANEYIKNNNAIISVSATTRKIRNGEVDGINYYFLNENEFKNWIEKDNFLEYAMYNNCYYGTPKSKIEENLNNGIDVFLVIEVKGGLQIKEKVKESILIFLLPPDMDELKRRLSNRNTDTKEMIDNRMKIAEEEIKVSEKYDYRIINNDIKTTVKQIENIIKSEKLKD